MAREKTPKPAPAVETPPGFTKITSAGFIHRSKEFPEGTELTLPSGEAAALVAAGLAAPVTATAEVPVVIDPAPSAATSQEETAS
jgi:hypothetical protein